jgi:phenylacetate-CoA ligase
VYWNEKEECLPVEQLRRRQLENLQRIVARVYERVPFYRRRMDEKGVKPADIRTLDDIRLLPFTIKDDMREGYPFGLFAVPLQDVVRIHSSSGTTGKPIVAGYTRADIALWAQMMARTFGCGEVTSRDIVQVAYGYGLFTGGLGAHYGAELIGATVVPMSGGNNKRQIMLMQDFGTTVLACTPSYALALAETAAEMGVAASALRLRVGFFGAEPWPEEMRAAIEQRLLLKAIDIYGLTEVIGPGVASECMEQKGLHVFEDHFYPEVINPDTGEPLPEGERGEMVFTCLTKEAFPLLRFRTRDITRMVSTRCPCGRTFRRMEKVGDRTDDMLIIRGVNVFPSQIETVLLSIEEAEPHFQIIVRREGPLDELEVLFEVDEAHFSDEVKVLQAIEHKVAREIESAIGLHAIVRLVEPKTIERSMGKRKRVIDLRKEPKP